MLSLPSSETLVDWDPVTLALVVTLPLVAVEVALVGLLVEEAADEEDEASTPSQLRSNRGVVVSSLPTMPKLGLGVSGAASCRVYHLLQS